MDQPSLRAEIRQRCVSRKVPFLLGPHFPPPGVTLLTTPQHARGGPTIGSGYGDPKAVMRADCFG